jgi:diacylglycerol kinase family enzyme
MQVLVLLNQSAGPERRDGAPQSPEDIRGAFRELKVDASVRTVGGDELTSAAKEAAQSGIDGVVAGGGDGTVSAVAAGLAGGSTPLGVLPLGTLNHFAKDNGLPLDLAGSAGVIAAGHVAALDVARVNDRVFINNSSLGVYARALVDRDERRDRTGMGKWPAMLLASWKIFRRSPLVRVQLATDDGVETIKTPLVFVGNNPYQLDLFRVGTRACLSDGVLSLYIARTQSRWGMVKLGVRAALGRLQQARDFDTRCVASVDIHVRRTRIHVALDGEVMPMDAPLVYRIWPQSLPVFVPPAESEITAPAGKPRRPK